MSLVKEFIHRRIAVRPVTVATVVGVQVLLTVANVVALRQNAVLRERAQTYLAWAAPLVGREVSPITGVDWKGARRTVEYNQDQRPTLIYTLSKDCPNCAANWTAMHSIQNLSPARLRVVYIDTADQLTEEYVREHGMAQDIVFSKLDAYSALNYQTRGTPQAELVDRQGRVVWSRLGEFRSVDIAKLLAAIEKHEGLGGNQYWRKQMIKKIALRTLGMAFFVLSVTVSGLTFATVASAQEDEKLPCPACDEIDLSCVGSPCTCQWGYAGHKCVR